MEISDKTKLSLQLLLGISLCAAHCSPVFAQDRTHSSDNELLFSDDAIVTTASKTALRVSDVPAAVSVITEEQIKASGATTIPDLLRSVPGVDVMEPNSSQSNVSIRGFNTPFAARLLVMIDGRTIYQDLFDGVFWNSTPLLLARIKRIEIVRGPGSALYGGNALNGMINIITKAPEEISAENRVGQATVLRGSHNGLFAEALGHVTPAKDWNAVFGAGYRQSDGMGDNKPGQVKDTNRVPIFSLDVQKRVSRGSLRLNLDSASTVEDMSSAYLVIPKSHLSTRDAILTYNEDRGSAPTMARFFINSMVSPGPAVSDLKTYDLEVQQQRDPSKNQHVIYGGNYRLLGVKTTLTGSDTHHQTLWSLYAQDDIRLATQTHLFASARYDKNSLYGKDISPHVSLVHHLAHSQTVRLSYGTAFRPPTPLDSYIDLTIPVGPGQYLHTIGNLKLKPEEVTSLEAGYRWDLRGGSIGVNLFDNHLSKSFQYVFMPPATLGGPAIRTQVNASTAHAQGFELDGAFTLSPQVHGAANYSYQNVVDGTGNQVALSPRSKLNLTLEGRLSSRLSATVIGHYVGKSVNYSAASSKRGDIGSYTRVDGNIGYRLGLAQQPVMVTLSVTNLFDDKHLEDLVAAQSAPNVVAPQRRTVWFGLSGSF